MGPEDLDQILKDLPIPKDPKVLVGLDTSDDAGVYQLSEEVALVQTVDFFTPIVDDPFTFGQIAVANALSDVYAMGGTPLTALNLVAFPIKDPFCFDFERDPSRRPLENGGGGSGSGGGSHRGGSGDQIWSGRNRSGASEKNSHQCEVQRQETSSF